MDSQNEMDILVYYHFKNNKDLGKYEFLREIPQDEKSYLFVPISGIMAAFKNQNWEELRSTLRRIPRGVLSNVEKIKITGANNKYEEILSILAAFIPLTRGGIPWMQIDGVKFMSELELKLIQTLLTSEYWEQEKTIEYIAWLVFSKRFHIVQDKFGIFVVPFSNLKEAIKNVKTTLIISALELLNDNALKYIPNKNVLIGIDKKGKQVIESIKTICNVIKIIKVEKELRNRSSVVYGEIIHLKEPKVPESEDEDKLFFKRINAKSPIHCEVHEAGSMKMIVAVDLIKKHKEFYVYLKYPNKELFLKQIGRFPSGIRKRNGSYEITFEITFPVARKKGILQLRLVKNFLTYYVS